MKKIKVDGSCSSTGNIRSKGEGQDGGGRGAKNGLSDDEKAAGGLDDDGDDKDGGGANKLETGKEADEKVGDSSNSNPAKKRKLSFIGIHLGAGEHSEKRKEKYKTLCDAACSKAMKILRAGGSAGDAVTQAIKILEDSGLVNAGSGSNLTLEGTVECDAGFMDGDGYFGGVGGVSGVPNPVVVAQAIADVHKKEKLFSCSRVPPNFMVGSAAKSWAASKGIPTCEDKTLISKRATKTYEKYMSQLKSSANDVNDTVGAVALDNRGEVAAAVSSGGNWLKYPGRIGHSPLFACGCYCCNLSPGTDNAIAISTSGSGEMLSRVRLPQECAQEANSESSFGLVGSLIAGVNKHFLYNATLDIHREPRLLGLIALSWNGSRGEFAWAHSASNFVIAYSSSKMRSTKMQFSELGTNTVPGQSLKAEGISF